MIKKRILFFWLAFFLGLWIFPVTSDVIDNNVSYEIILSREKINAGDTVKLILKFYVKDGKLIKKTYSQEEREREPSVYPLRETFSAYRISDSKKNYTYTAYYLLEKAGNFTLFIPDFYYIGTDLKKKEIRIEKEVNVGEIFEDTSIITPPPATYKKKNLHFDANSFFLIFSSVITLSLITLYVFFRDKKTHLKSTDVQNTSDSDMNKIKSVLIDAVNNNLKNPDEFCPLFKLYLEKKTGSHLSHYTYGEIAEFLDSSGIINNEDIKQTAVEIMRNCAKTAYFKNAVLSDDILDITRRLLENDNI